MNALTLHEQGETARGHTCWRNAIVSHQRIGHHKYLSRIAGISQTFRKPLSFHKNPILYTTVCVRGARNKAAMIDPARHLVLQAAHPSPLSAYKGFFGCRHFSKANAFLEKNGMKPIRWQIDDL